MKEEKDILSKVNRSTGMTVPDGYFADFASRMKEALPEKQSEPEVVTKTTWQKIRPYAYLAAMFAGVWCMMKMFSMMLSGTPADINIDNNSMLVSALTDVTFVEDYYLQSMDDYDIMMDIYEDGFTTDEITEYDASLQQ